MSDLISRADAIEAVHEYYQKRFTEDSKWDADAKMLVLEDKTIAKDNMEICNIIKALPSAEAVPWSVADKIGEDRERLEERVSELEERLEWIPCSESLPSEGEDVLITIKWKDGVITVEKSKLRDYNYWVGFGRDVNVVAWQPLPAPYKGGDTE